MVALNKGETATRGTLEIYFSQRDADYKKLKARRDHLRNRYKEFLNSGKKLPHDESYEDSCTEIEAPISGDKKIEAQEGADQEIEGNIIGISPKKVLYLQDGTIHELHELGGKKIIDITYYTETHEKPNLILDERDPGVNVFYYPDGTIQSQYYEMKTGDANSKFNIDNIYASYEKTDKGVIQVKERIKSWPKAKIERWEFEVAQGELKAAKIERRQLEFAKDELKDKEEVTECVACSVQ